MLEVSELEDSLDSLIEGVAPKATSLFIAVGGGRLRLESLVSTGLDSNRDFQSPKTTASGSSIRF